MHLIASYCFISYLWELAAILILLGHIVGMNSEHPSKNKIKGDIHEKINLSRRTSKLFHICSC